MLNPDFKEILSEFSAANVEFLLVGGYALAAHGHPRATGDLDLWVRPEPENAKRVVAAVTRFGAPPGLFSVDELSRVDMIFQMGVEPRRIDVITSITGIAFDEAWRTRETIDIEGLKVPVIGKADLIANKKASGRPQDLVDVRSLERPAGPRTE